MEHSRQQSPAGGMKSFIPAPWQWLVHPPRPEIQGRQSPISSPCTMVLSHGQPQHGHCSIVSAWADSSCLLSAISPTLQPAGDPSRVTPGRVMGLPLPGWPRAPQLLLTAAPGSWGLIFPTGAACLLQSVSVVLLRDASTRLTQPGTQQPWAGSPCAGEELLLAPTPRCGSGSCRKPGPG